MNEYSADRRYRRVDLPRKPDGAVAAWTEEGATPVEVWKRGSAAYESQLAAVLEAMESQGYDAVADFAGSEDGEAALALDEDGEIAVLIHLEDPQDAAQVARAIDEGTLSALIDRLAH